MSFFRSVYGLIRGGKSAREAEIALVDAYTALVHGQPTPGDVQMVVVDLARFSGYFDVSGESVPAEALRFREGKRAMFERVLMLSNMTNDERMALEGAAREEATVYRDNDDT